MREKITSLVRGRGKPRKSQEIIARMVLEHDPELAGSALFESVEAQALPIEETTIGGKLERISRIIGLRLGNAVSEAGIAHDSEIASDEQLDGRSVAASLLGPWIDGKSPENAFSFAERAVHANDRVMSTLVRHLVEHVVIDHELRQIAADARRRAADELRDIPLSMVDFVNRLMASGVVVDDVRDMPKGRLAKVVSAIKEIDRAEALDMVPDNLPASTWSDAGDGSPTGARHHDGDALSGGSDGLIGDGFSGGETGAPAMSGDTSDAPLETVVEPVSDALEQTAPDTVEPAGDATTRNDVGEPAGTRNDVGGSDAIRPAEGGSGDASGNARGDAGLPLLDVIADGSDVSDARPGERLSDDGLDGVREALGAAATEPPLVVDDTPSATPEDVNPQGAHDDGNAGTGGDMIAGTDATEAPADQPASGDPAPAPSATGGAMWDMVETDLTGYRIEQHVISSDEDHEARRLQLPEARTMSAMAMPNSLESTLATGAEKQGDGKMAHRFVGRYCLRTGTTLTEEERRLWLFLLYESRPSSEGRHMGRDGFFDGVRIPPSSVSAKVRRLVAVDRSRLADAADAATLAGPAKHRK